MIGVIFDMDGVLTDTARLHCESWQQLADELRIPFSADRYQEMRGLARESSLAILLGEASERMPAEQRKALLERKQQLFLDRLARFSAADRCPGVTELIGDLRRAGARLAVGSSSRNTLPVLRQIELLHAFDAIVDANDVAESKPSPAIFLEAARRLGLPPQSCVVLEDAYAGIAAARAAGMRVVGVGEAAEAAGADAYVVSLEALSAKTLERLLC